MSDKVARVLSVAALVVAVLVSVFSFFQGQEAADPVARSYGCAVYTEQGCAKYVVASGGEIEVQSGGIFDIQTGATVAMVAPYAAKTASYSVTAAETGSLFSNAGATAEITLTLPAAVQGLNYCFYVYAAYTVTLELDGSDQFHHITNSAGDRAQNTGTAGDSICWVAADVTYWVPVHETGTWSDAN